MSNENRTEESQNVKSKTSKAYNKGYWTARKWLRDARSCRLAGFADPIKDRNPFNGPELRAEWDLGWTTFLSQFDRP